MGKIEYKVEKDKEFVGQRYETYTIEKKITYSSGDVEIRTKVFIPFRDGDINKVDFDKIDFPKPITSKEWEQLSEEYHKAWINGTMTEELCKELEKLRLEEGVA